MRPSECGTTRSSLLMRLGDWRDHVAWHDFVEQYEPLVRSCGVGHGLDAAATEELCQQIWIELASKLRTFQYDPSKRFRNWLHRRCRFRALDLRKKRQANRVRLLADEPDAEQRLAIDP